MANFAPLKRHMLGRLDRFVAAHALAPPFLEVGCGRGDVSAHLARRGWHGTAIDTSDAAIAAARATLSAYPQVEVRHVSLEATAGTFPTIVMWDVLEHVDDDAAALAQVARLLAPGGHLLLAVPSNPREWRWDDDFYGHLRRYTVEDLAGKLRDAGLDAVAFEDFTFPLYWAMRRAYTRLGRPPAAPLDAGDATKASALRSAWDRGALARALDATAALWGPLNRLQSALFAGATARGHEFFALARKRAV
jgi:SAM-dependent methyltransferase